MFVFSSD
jgi:hypothetical protein